MNGLKSLTEGRLAVHYPPTTEMGAFIVLTTDILNSFSKFINQIELDNPQIVSTANKITENGLNGSVHKSNAINDVSFMKFYFWLLD